MQAAENSRIAETWLGAFNNRNLDLLISLYDPQAVHFSPKLKIRKPETEGFIRGHAAMREWWKDSFERLPTLKYTKRTLTADHTRVFMEYIRSVDGEEEMNIAEVLEIQDGKIIASRVYHG